MTIDSSLIRLLEVEKSVLGAALSHPEAASQWGLTAEDFVEPFHSRVWETIQTRLRAGEETDAVSVGFALDEKYPGKGYMADIGAISRDFVFSPTTGASHARIVREKGLERAAAGLARRFAEKEIDQTELVNGLKALAGKRDIPAYSAASSLRDLVDHMSNPPEAIPTGIHRLDDQFSGLHKGDLVILQARPAIGKTAIALSIARNMVKLGRGVLFYSGEMPAAQIMGRLVSIEAGVPAYKFRSGKLSDDQWSKFNEAALSLQDKPLYIVDPSKPLLDDIVHVAHAMVEQKGLEVLVVDYAQRIKTRNTSREFRHSQIEIATTLKGLARELDICVLLLAQSGRRVDEREEKSYGQLPGMGDIQESAAYEQEADMVMGLARKDCHAMLAVLKNRHGPVGLVPMEFDPPTMEFRSVGADAVPALRFGRS